MPSKSPFLPLSLCPPLQVVWPCSYSLMSYVWICWLSFSWSHDNKLYGRKMPLIFLVTLYSGICLFIYSYKFLFTLPVSTVGQSWEYLTTFLNEKLLSWLGLLKWEDLPYLQVWRNNEICVFKLFVIFKCGTLIGWLLGFPWTTR